MDGLIELLIDWLCI